MTQGSLSSEHLKKLDSSIRKAFADWSNELCAEHDGTITSFPSLSVKLADIHLYPNLFTRNSINVLKAAKYAGYGAAGVLAAAGLVTTGGGAAPIAAALGKLGLLGAAGTGTAIATLSGAALTNASLAAIGGSVATGTLVITAVGASLGGIQGGVIANRYHADDPSFAIHVVNNTDSPHRTIFINGFTEQKNETFEEWKSQQLTFDTHQRLYGVVWSSKSRLELGQSFAQGVTSKYAIAALKEIGKVGGRTASKGLNPLFLLDAIGDLLGNPWHTSMVRAAQAGVQLAEAISRTSGASFTLVGHSLGCRVIYYALEALSSKNEKFISNVVLLGGAVGRNDREGWSRACLPVAGKIINCYSNKDKVLEYLYRTANAGLSDPIGIRPIIQKDVRITNVDCSDLVESHQRWKPQYSNIIRRIRASEV